MVGSGFDDVNGEAWVHSFNVGDGSLAGSVKLSENFGGRNKTTRSSMVDLNLDGQTDLVYVADLLGSGEPRVRKENTGWLDFSNEIQTRHIAVIHKTTQLFLKA